MKCTLLSLCLALLSTILFAHQKPLEFLENLGQWENDVLFRANMGNAAVFLVEDGFVFNAFSSEDLQIAHDQNLWETDAPLHGHAWKLQFIGTTDPEKVEASKKNSTYYNFFIGQDTSRWKGRVGSYQEVYYTNIWPGIDLKVYSNTHPKGSNFKYDFIVHPGADPSVIQWKYEGLDGVDLINEELILETSVGKFTEAKPWSYQEDEKVECDYFMVNDTFRFLIPNDFDYSSKLIIDPELIAATFIGAQFNSAYGICATYDVEGNMISGARSYGVGYPATFGAYSDTFMGGQTEMGIGKFNSNGTELLWATYIGGANGEDSPLSLVTNTNQNIYVHGYSSSSDYPTTPNAFRSDLDSDGINCGVVSLLSADGASLLGSTYIASTSGSLHLTINGATITCSSNRGEIILDKDENPVIATNTTSSTFPISTNAYQSILKGQIDAAVVSFNKELSQINWGTYVGGEGSEYYCSLRIDQNERVILAGGELEMLKFSEVQYPTTINAYQEEGMGSLMDREAVISILNADGSELLYSTYFSTPEDDSAFLVELDSNEDIWVCGMSLGEIPLVGNAYSNAPSPTYVAKFSSDLSDLELSTQVGPGLGIDEFIAPTAFMIDNCDRLYLSGCSNNAMGFSSDIPITDDAIFDDGGFYLAQYSPNMSSLEFASFFGGSHTHGGQSRFNKKGAVYQAVCSPVNSSFQAMSGAWSEQQGEDVSFELAVFKVDFESDAAVSQFSYETLGVCSPVDVQFSNYSTEGAYTWFVDGNEIPSGDDFLFNFTNPGDHEVELVVTNEASCNYSDTLSVHIDIPAATSMQSSWEIDPVDLCQDSLVISAVYTGSNEESLLWQFPGGSSNESTIDLNFFESGSYPITLVVYDEQCNVSDTLETVFDYDPLDASWITVSSDPCLDSLYVFGIFTGSGQEEMHWEYNDGSSTFSQVDLAFGEQGSYFLDLILFDENCQQLDTLSAVFELQGTIEAFALANTLEGCEPLNVQLSGSSNIGTGAWTTPQGVFATDEVNMTFDQAGVYQSTFVVTDENSCNLADSTLIEILVHPSLEASMTVEPINPSPCAQEQLVQLTFTGENATQLAWNTGDGVTLFGENATYIYSFPGNYTITLTSDNSVCNQQEILAQDLLIELDASEFNELVFPNVISPNDDGMNDRLEFSKASLSGEEFDVFNLKIFNRWGTLIFESDQSQNSWDGRAQGEIVHEGVYYYILEYQISCATDGVQVKRGNVEVVR